MSLLSAPAPAAEYTATRLQLLNGLTNYSPEALSEDGRVGGYVRRSSTQSPFDLAVIWDRNGLPSPLPMGVEFDQTTVIGFTREGTPVGGIVNGKDFPAGFWNANGFVPLPDPANGGVAFDGVGTLIVGFTYNPGRSATVWDADGYHLLPNLEGVSSQVTSINAAAVYVGNTSGAGGFVGQNRSATRINYPDFPTAVPFEINDSNWLTGIWFPDLSQFVRRGFVARAFSNEIYDLGVFPGYVESFIGGINNDNTIVGAARNSGDYEKALIWLNGSLVPQDLNLMVDIPNVSLIRAMEINNAGQILVEGFSQSANEFSYYVLSPIPEPGCVLIASATFAIKRSARRRPSR